MGKSPRLSSSELLLQDIVESIPVRIFWKDCDLRYLGCNTLFARDAGLACPEDLIGKSDYEMGWQEQAELYRLDDQAVIDSGIPRLGYEEPQSTPDGKTIWLRTSKVPLRDGSQNVIGILGIYENITEHVLAKEAEKRLTRALKLLSKCNMLLVHAESEQDLLAEICQLAVGIGGYRMAWVGFAEKDVEKSIRLVAQAGIEKGYLATAKITWADAPSGQGPTGSAIRNRMTVVNQDCLSNPSMAPWREAALEHGYQSSIALPLVCKKGVLGALTIYAAEPHAFGSEEVQLLEELASDLAYGIETLRMRAEHEASEKKLEFLRQHDTLTGLPNRILLRDRFEQAVAAAARGNSDVAVLVLDVDNFKQINDSLGHALGDQLLVRTVERLQGCIRNTDTISRQGGDEFVILLTGVRDVETIEVIAQNIIEAFAEPFAIDGHMLVASFSIGISIYPDDGTDFDMLFKKADTSLYQAKDAGKNAYRFFTEQMNVDAMEHMQLQGMLRNAINNGEFILHYQPQVDIGSGRIVGAEALLRWQHPTLGLVPPDRFIPLAERSGLIVPIGEWVINEACRQAQAWRETDGLLSMMIAVNLSALQFKRGNIVETVSRALSRSGLPAGLLELELTESILLQDVASVMQTLRDLKGIGIKLSIDDFGTGYSSLSYLKRLAVDKLKIDQSFVQDMVDDADAAAIVMAIIQLGSTLQLTTIAEGVENELQHNLLEAYGCDEIQGYFYARPLPAEELVAYCQGSVE